MTENSEQPRTSRGILPLSILAAILAIVLAWYLNSSPASLVSEVPASMLEEVGTEEVSSAQADTSNGISNTDSGTDSDSDDADASEAEAADSDAADADAGEAEATDADAADADAGEAEATDADAADADAGEAEAGEAEAGDAGTDVEADSNTDTDADADSDDANADDANADDANAVTDDTGADEVQSNKPEPNTVVGTYNGMPVGYTEDGLVFRGDPDAPITIYEFSDYQCPFCLRHFSQTETALNEAYVETGQAKVVFVDFPLVQLHPNAPAASAASLCVAEQDPVAYWEMHALVFETQNQWANSSEPIAYFQELGAQLDIDQDDFASCLESGRADAMVERSYAWGRSLGFSGTPSFQFATANSDETYDLVGAQPFDRFQSWIDALAAGEVPADAAPQANAGAEGGGEQEIPYWATEEGLTPDPEREGFTMAGDAYRGSLDAPIVVIEYSDYQCPFCRRHTEDTQPLLDEQFVDTDQVRWVFRHFPLNIHPQAPMAGVAAECAGEQGQFWEMHELLFANVSAWSISDPTAPLTNLAAQLSLDAEPFAECLADEDMLERINSDFADGRPFVQGTPTFIVMTGGQGRIIPGALPADTFAQALEDIITEEQ